MDQKHYSTKTLQVLYTSGWYTVVLPTLICLGVWGGFLLGILLSWAGTSPAG